MKTNHDQHACQRQFSIGDLLLDRNFGQGSFWLSGVVSKVCGQVSYVCGDIGERESDATSCGPLEATLDNQTEIVVPAAATDIHYSLLMKA